MKKFLIATAALLTLSAGAAQAEVNLDLNFGQPVYVAPAPVYVEEHPWVPEHYNGRDRHHEGRDWREHRDWRDHEEHDHHDNGRHLGEIKHDR